MPLLYALRDDLGMNNPRFGCGLAQCGACTVLLNGEPVRSCATPVDTVGDKKVTTLNGIGTAEKPHKVQAAFIEEQVPQCGYCLNGWIMTSVALLEKNPQPTDGRSAKRSPASSAAAARTPRSCAPSSARRRLEGGSHEHATSIAVTFSQAPAPSSSRSRCRASRRAPRHRRTTSRLAAQARAARDLYQHQPGRQRGRLGRQGRHGPGHRYRLDQDDRRRARPADRSRQHGAGPYRPDHQSWAALPARPASGRAARRCATPRPKRAACCSNGVGKARRAGRSSDRHRRRRQRQERRRQESLLRRSDRRPAFRRRRSNGTSTSATT